jgi:pseudouridine kinase
VLCVGGAVLDLKFRLVAASVPGTSNPSGLLTSFGGVARNVAENLAALLPSVNVELLSCVGDDAAGAALLTHAREHGVGVEKVRVVAGESTAQYVAVLEPDGELTIGAAAMSVLDRIEVDMLDAAWPQRGWVFCDGNLSAVVLAQALQLARRDGTALVVDAVSTAKVTRLPSSLEGLTLLSCNRDEARAWLAFHQLAVQRSALGEPADPSDIALAQALRAAGAQAVLLTLGASGLIVAQADGVVSIPAFPATPVDVTGAGDALIAGVLAALIGGDDLVAAATAGAWRAARTIESEHSVLPAGAEL